MTKLVDDAMFAEAIEAAGFSLDGAVAGPFALASPSYKALESRSMLIGHVFAKQMHPEMRTGFDLNSAMLAAQHAGDVGAGPKVLSVNAQTGFIAMQALLDGWVTADQGKLQDALTLVSAMASVKKFHQTAALPSRFDPFAQIDVLTDDLECIPGALPDDIIWLRHLVKKIEAAMRDTGLLLPCRNDGSSSNLMLGPEGQVLLIDFDRAGMNDPLYDVGCILAEVTDFERSMHAGYVAYAGSFDEAGFARARLWSHVDDLLHALWARHMAHTSERRTLEWLKYGEWRLMRARMALMHPQFEEKIRIVGGGD
jgi:hypothetical protein